jgi:hypothetical protein
MNIFNISATTYLVKIYMMGVIVSVGSCRVKGRSEKE